MVGARGIGESEDKGEHTGLQRDRWPTEGFQCGGVQCTKSPTKDFYQSGRDRVELMTMLNAQGVMVRVLPNKELYVVQPCRPQPWDRAQLIYACADNAHKRDMLHGSLQCLAVTACHKI